jgi:muconate cycloisomerase
VKIVSVETFRVDVPLVGNFKSAHFEANVQPCAVVRVRTDDGFEGVGDVEPHAGDSSHDRDETADALEHKIVPALIGADPRRPREAARIMAAAAPGYAEAQAAVDIALADIHGKSLGVPVHELLGGRVKDEIFFNAWIGIQAPEKAAAEALDYCEKGWTSCKVKASGDVESDAARVHAVRGAVGGRMAIRIDANESYGDVESAVALAREVRSADPVLFEQPVSRNDIGALARIRRAIDIPVMADECLYGLDSLLRIIKAEAADIVKVKVMKHGGLIATREIAAAAEAAGMRIVIGHGFGLTGNTLAEIHVAATSDAFFPQIESVGRMKMKDDLVDQPMDITAGRVPVPQGPGLGVTLNEDKLEMYRVKGSEGV